MASVVTKNAARFPDGFLRHFSPEIQKDQIGLRNFLKLASEDPLKTTTKKSVKQLIHLLKEHPELKSLDKLNFFLKAYGSAAKGLKFLRDLSGSQKTFSLRNDLDALTDIFISAGNKQSFLFPLSKVMEMFSHTPVNKVAALISDLVKADSGKSSIVLNAFYQAGRRMTDIQNCQLVELGIQAGQDAGEFFIQVAAALPKVSASEILLKCANSDKRLVDLVRSLTRIPEVEIRQAA